jgi:hypothetical protein
MSRGLFPIPLLDNMFTKFKCGILLRTLFSVYSNAAVLDEVCQVRGLHSRFRDSVLENRPGEFFRRIMYGKFVRFICGKII